MNEPTTNVAYLNVGKSKNLKYYNVKAAGATWDVVDKAAPVTVNAKGAVKASQSATGKAVVTCTYDPYPAEGVSGTGFTYQTIVYVENVKLNTENGLTLKKGDNYELSIKVGEKFVLQTEGNSQPVQFASSKPAVAFVDEAGVVSGRGKGTAKLSARVNGKKIVVNVTAAE